MSAGLVALGAVGGFVAQAVGTFQLQRGWTKQGKKGVPVEMATWLFPVEVLFWIGGGGLFVYVQEGSSTLTRLLALQIGATAPLFFERLIRSTPEGGPGTVDKPNESPA